MRIGAHVPTRGGLLSAIGAARECGAEAVQLFISNPRSWLPPRIGRGEAEEFRAAWRESGLGPLFVHAPYLVNIASPNPEFLLKSVDLVRRSVAAAAAIGATGFVVHSGSGGPDEPSPAFERAAATLQATVPESDETVILVELTAGTSGSVAATFPEATRLFDAVDDERLRLCADTCHLFVAGYGLDEPDGARACFDELRSTGLADRLVLVHANDAKFGRGSRRDRHERIGEGHIGRDGFAAILAEPAVRDLSLVLETPGDLADHRAQIELLRGLAGRRYGSRSAPGPSW